MYIPEDQFVNVGAVNTRFWVAGEGMPVVLLHGITNSVEDWLLNFDTLAKSNRVYAVDLIGHGKTDKPLSSSYHIDDLSDFIIAFMDAVEVKQATIVGHSLGGWIALNMAIRHTDYVLKLVLVSSAGLGKEATIEIRLITVPGLGEFLTDKFLGVDFEKYLVMQRKNWPDASTATDEMIRLKYDATRWQDIKPTVLKTFRSTANLFGVKDREYLPIVTGLPLIECPILAIWGQQDELAPVTWTKKLAEGCPQVQIEIIDGCGHDAMVEHPKLFNKVVVDFLKN